MGIITWSLRGEVTIASLTVEERRRGGLGKAILGCWVGEILLGLPGEQAASGAGLDEKLLLG